MASQPKLVHRYAALADGFGLAYATRLFGETAIASLPVFVRGTKKGKIKGFIHWVQCESDGFDRRYGYCHAGKLVWAHIGESRFTMRQDAMFGLWYGHTQRLSASAYYLGQQARDREIGIHAQRIVDWEVEKAERAKA